MKRNLFLVMPVLLGLLISLAGVHFDVMACPFSCDGDYVAAEKPSDELIKLYNQGRRLYEQGKYDEAIDIYKKCIEKDPAFDNAYGSLGRVYYELKKYSEAVPLFRKAIELNPSDPFYYNELGVNYARLGQREKAIEVTRKAVELSPGDAACSINLARMLTADKDKKNIEEALDVLNRALAKVADPEGKKMIENLIKKIQADKVNGSKGKEDKAGENKVKGAK